jgi:hypothetical protein
MTRAAQSLLTTAHRLTVSTYQNAFDTGGMPIRSSRSDGKLSPPRYKMAYKKISSLREGRLCAFQGRQCSSKNTERTTKTHEGLLG